jgi:pimeloyl-ACP methyl ester carboxylesterase
MHDEAALVPEVLEATGITRAVLFGHSDGGSIAIIAAAEHPRLVSSLVLEAAHVFVEDVSIASITRVERLYREANLRERLARHHRDVDAAFRGWSDVWLDPGFRSWNLEGYLPRVTCPTLLIQGDLDEYGTLAQITAIERQLTGASERLLLGDCGHSPHRDRPDLVLDTIDKFLAAQP